MAKTLKGTKARGWNIFSRYIKLKYSDKGFCVCITCGKKMKNNDRNCHAGHAFGGRGGNILFCEEIVRPQCCHCNIFLKGNYEEFHAWILKEYGEEGFWKYHRLKNTPHKWTIEEIEVGIETWKAEIEKMEKGKGVNRL